MGRLGGGVTATGGVEAALRMSSLLREPKEMSLRPLMSVSGGVAESDGDGAGAGKVGNASGIVFGASDDADISSCDGDGGD